MFRHKGKSLIVFVMLISIFVSGCGIESSGLIIESGVVDEEYRGVANPQLEKTLKLTEEEKINGIEKVSIERTEQADAPSSFQDGEETGDEDANESGGEEVARPKI